LKRIIVSVSNDLTTDQRVHKICTALIAMNYKVILIGRLLPNSQSINRNYRTIRMPLLFKKGFLFYAELNVRLFFKLFFLKKDILLANDLDTLLPNFLISRLFAKKIVYDSHEYFTEVPELTKRPFVKNIWVSIERFIFPKLKNVYTVNDEIAKIYHNKYGVKVSVVRNIAPKQDHSIGNDKLKELKGNQKMLILQGAGINKDRGAEEAVQMMQYLDNIVLYIIGSGDVFKSLKKLVENLKLQTKVIIIDKLPYNQLLEYTKIADLGLSLDKNTNLNYELSLPNKVFDYIQSQTPLFVTNRKVVANLVIKNKIGYVTNTTQPYEMAIQIREIFKNDKQIACWKNNLIKVAKIYCWENEVLKLKNIYQSIC